MGIIDDIKDRLDIVEEIKRYVTLQQAGGRWKGLCPFHQEKTPSFFVFPDSARFKCFGCGAAGDILDFVMRYEGWNMNETIREMAKRAGIVLQPLSPEQRQAIQLQRDREAVFSIIAEWLHKRLMTPAADGTPSAGYIYVRDRGLTPEMITAHGLGYFGKDWNGLRAALAEKGVAPESPAAVAFLGYRGDVATWWTQAGLAGNPPQQWVQDKKIPAAPPDLLIYPHVLRGRVLYLSGRRVSPEGDMPKAWNPRRDLVGEKVPFFNALWGEVASHSVVIEGQMCAITLAQWGIPAVALAGCE